MDSIIYTKCFLLVVSIIIFRFLLQRLALLVKGRKIYDIWVSMCEVSSVDTYISIGDKVFQIVDS